jgi:ketosteroid isomerase-like protein
MIKQFIIPGLVAGFLVFSSCNNTANDKAPQSKTGSPEQPATEETLKHILDAFNRHDPDAIMEYFTDDCTFDFPRGPEPWGQRFKGKAQVREAIAGRFKGIPDVHYDDEGHWVAGDNGVSVWMLTGTKTSGESVKVRICVLWEFRKDQVKRMDTYWKIVESITD